jgi:hypothetical protein
MQSAVATREVNTFNENNLTGAAGVFAPTGMSFAESAGKDGSVITDFSGTTRPFGSSDIGAAEFAGTTFPVMNITVTSSTGLDSACAYFLPSLTATVPSSFTRLSFQWYRDTTKIPGATFKTVTVSAVSAKYTFKVYDSATGCTYSSTPFPITIVPLPPAQITYYDSLIFCESSAVVLYANKGYKYTYQWKRNGVGMIGETNDHYVASKSGDYSVEVNTPFGCAVTSTYIRVKVYPLPKPTVIYGGPRMLTTQKYYTYQWYMNGKKIDSFALNRIYYTFADAAYQVEVTDSNGCTAKSDVYLYSLGINDNAVASSIKIYPNPTSGQIHIESPIDLNIRLTDLTGRTIVDKVNNGIVDITNLADGMYLINISDKDGNLIKVEKISKTK